MTPNPKNAIQRLSEHIEDGTEGTNIDKESLRRAENVQLIVAIGILTVAGTLYVNEYISFPRLESLSSVSYVKTLFRLFVYSTILFVIAKVVTITIYPFTETELILTIHDRVEPFLYIFSPLLIALGLGFAFIVGEVGYGTLIVGLSGISSGLIAYFLSGRLSTIQREERKVRDVSKALEVLISVLARQNALENSPMQVTTIANKTGLSEDSVNELTKQASKEPTVPIKREGDSIWISNLDDAFTYVDKLKKEGMVYSSLHETTSDQ